MTLPLESLEFKNLAVLIHSDMKPGDLSIKAEATTLSPGQLEFISRKTTTPNMVSNDSRKFNKTACIYNGPVGQGLVP
jgi:hypothetical protein